MTPIDHDANYDAAFVHGPDEHDIEAVCHEPEADLRAREHSAGGFSDFEHLPRNAKRQERQPP